MSRIETRQCHGCVGEKAGRERAASDREERREPRCWKGMFALLILCGWGCARVEQSRQGGEPRESEERRFEPSNFEKGRLQSDGGDLRLPLRDLPSFGPAAPSYLESWRYVAGKKEPVGEQFLQLRLAEPLVGRWRLAAVGEPPTIPAVEPSDLRLEVRLLPRSLPRWRMVGSSMLNAHQDSSWIEFIGNKSDQVLKLKLDCQWTDSLRLVITPYFQVLPDATPMPLTAANREKVDQFMQWQGRRVQTQLQWLTARATNGMGGGKGGSGGKSGGGAGAQLLENRKLLEQQWKQLELARSRMEHLATLQRTLEQEGRVHVRLTQFSSGSELAIEVCDPSA